MVRRFILPAAVAALLAFAGTASAATYTMFAGEPSRPGGVPDLATLNGFYPRTVKIHAGDRVKISSMGFHNATFLGGTNPSDVPLLMPDPTGATYGSTPDDFAAQPWFFEALPAFIYNTLVFDGPVGDTVVDDRQIHGSGLLLPDEQGKPGTAIFSFPKPGTYNLLCTLHPGMSGKVIVRPAKARGVPSVKTTRTKARAELAASWARTAALEDADVPANTVYMGVGGRETLLQFLPETITVPEGTVVEFATESPSEVHNVLFGPLDWLGPFLTETDLIPFGPGAPNQAQPFLVYGSDPPGADGVYTYDGTNHGNGVFATPVADGQPGDPPQGLFHSFRVRFTEAGTYSFFCQIHGPDMSGTVVVTPAA